MAKRKKTETLIRDRMHGRHAYVAVQEGKKWTVARCNFGTAGYTPTILIYPTEAEADEIAGDMNEMGGLTAKEAAIIIGDTMRIRPGGQ